MGDNLPHSRHWLWLLRSCLELCKLWNNEYTWVYTYIHTYIYIYTHTSHFCHTSIGRWSFNKLTALTILIWKNNCSSSKSKQCKKIQICKSFGMWHHVRQVVTEISNGRCAYDTAGTTRRTHRHIPGPASSAAQPKLKFCTNSSIKMITAFVVSPPQEFGPCGVKYHLKCSKSTNWLDVHTVQS